MKEGVTFEGRKRKLPLWITAAADQEGKDRVENKTESRIKDGVLLQANLGNHRIGTIAQKDTLTEDPSPNAKSNTERRKKQSSLQNSDCVDVVSDPVPRKQGRNRRRKVQKAGTENCNLGCNDAYEASSLSDCEHKLTVEDLISIAKEYVKADESIVRQQKQADGGSTGVSTATSVTDAMEGSHNPPDSRAEFNQEGAVLGDSTESLTRNDIVCGTSLRSADCAQDMLDLFLGPLLKKLPKEKQMNFNMNETAFECEIDKKSQE